jgi:hypothetical protein
MAPTPIASVGQCVSATWRNTPKMSLMKDSLRGIDTPRSFDTCDSAMMIAAALVKPTTTGCERKLTTTPSLKMPSASWIRATSKVIMIASAMKSSLPGAARVAIDDAVSSDTTATGPVASWLEEPHIAATATGRKAAYRP